MLSQIVTQHKNSEISHDEIRILVNDEENHLSRSHFFCWFSCQNTSEKFVRWWGCHNTSKRQYDMRFNACLIFHKTVFLYGLENFPVNNDLLKHARAFNFLNQKWSFESACSISYCEELKSYVTLKLVSAIFYLIFIFHQMMVL